MIQFIKKNWVWLLIIIVILFGQKLFSNLSGPSISSSLTIPTFDSSTSLMSSSLKTRSSSVAPSESTNRIVIQDTSLSLQVKNVEKTISDIEDTTTKMGGFLIDSYVSKPEGAASGNISIRIPEDKRKEALIAFKNIAVKVVSESVIGNDVTDQYTDLEARLEVLEKTKAKYEEIMEKADTVSDLLSVQQQLTNLQTQIDSLKGQQKYYEQSAKLSKVVIYLSTDELALPYAPTNEWRPTVIFKEAVRSLIGTFRGIGSFMIWVVVYIPLLIVIASIIWIIRRIKRSRYIAK